MARRFAPYLGLVLGLCLGVTASYVRRADASRNSSGTYSLPSGNPVVSGTTIQPTWANTTLSDLATEVTNSVDRNGRGAMLAPLQCSNGTVAAPSLTFGSDTDTGLYRIAANNPAIAAGGVKSQEWTATTSTFAAALAVTGAQTNAAGITVTQSTANTTAGTFTGNGTGHGLSVTGGTGAAATGITVAAGSGSNGNGISSLGRGTGSGVSSTGGGTDGRGGSFFGGAANGPGVAGTGSGTGYGVLGVGGATGTGVVGTAGGSPTADTNTRYAFEATAGHYKASGGNPTSTTGFADSLTPTNIVKAWGLVVTNGSGSATVSAGFNVASATISGSNLRINFATGMASTSFACIATGQSTATVILYSASRNASYCEIGGFTDAGAAVNFSNTVREISVLVLGAQ